MQWFRRHNHLPSQIPQGIQRVDKFVSSAQLLNLHEAPIMLIAAAGAGTIIQPLGAHIRKSGNVTMNYGPYQVLYAAYGADANGSSALSLGDALSNTEELSIEPWLVTPSGPKIPYNQIVNQSVYLHTDYENPLQDGTHDVTLTVFYVVI